MFLFVTFFRFCLVCVSIIPILIVSKLISRPCSNEVCLDGKVLTLSLDFFFYILFLFTSTAIIRFISSSTGRTPSNIISNKFDVNVRLNNEGIWWMYQAHTYTLGLELRRRNQIKSTIIFI